MIVFFTIQYFPLKPSWGPAELCLRRTGWSRTVRSPGTGEESNKRLHEPSLTFLSNLAIKNAKKSTPKLMVFYK